MSFSLTGTPIIDREVHKSTLHPGGFGFSLRNGDPISLDFLEELFHGELSEDLWEFVNIFGFVRAQVGEIHNYRLGHHSQPIMNNRERVNVLPHKDSTPFFLGADAWRSEQTVIAPRDDVLRHFWDVLEFHLGMFPDLFTLIRQAREEIQSVVDMSSLIEDALMDDLVGSRIGKLVTDLSQHDTLHDARLYAISHDLSSRLRHARASHEITWEPGVVVWISKIAFHYRLCMIVDEISQVPNGLYRHARRPGSRSSAYMY